ncbi:MAG: histidine phosphatase family protein [Verrucomicrobiales bacterium]|nr:histidine phosphatase family protein [Verrucomicrobiales bacterium]
MKTLFAVRHAMPCRDFQGNDYDRPLSDIGASNCEKMGQHLLDYHPAIEAIRASSANRTRSTARLIAEQINFPEDEIVQDENWYLAPANVWLQVVQQLPEGCATAMIIGHNPGMSEFSQMLQVEPEYQSFPPLSISKLQLDIDYWGEADWATAKQLEYLCPGNL